MRQLSNLTKVMFGIVGVLLVITVVLGIATAVKDSKKKEANQGQEVTGTGAPSAPPSGTPSNPPEGGSDATPVPGENEGQPSPIPTDEPAATPTAAPSTHKIAIDPGQQLKADTGKEPIGPGATTTTAKMSYGATSVTTNLREHEWNLTISKKLKQELIDRGYEVYMTREEADVQISNAERAAAANKSGAEIYISIQADAADNTSANGIYAQIPSKTNAFVSYLYEDCKRLATVIQSKLISATGAYDRGLMETDNVAAINWSEIPVTVLQLGFMTNTAEDKKLQSADYQDTLVKAICDGIDAYFAETD